MSSPSPPPLPPTRTSRKSRASSPHPAQTHPSYSSNTIPTTGAGSGLGPAPPRSRSHSRPRDVPPAPSRASSTQAATFPEVLRQASNASSAASSTTYVEPPASWRARAREARLAEPALPMPPGYTNASSASNSRKEKDRDAYMSSSSTHRAHAPAPAPTSSRSRKSTGPIPVAHVLAPVAAPPRFIVQSPSTSSMDREGADEPSSWSHGRAGAGVARSAQDETHIRKSPVPTTASQSVGLRSPADLSMPATRSSSRSSNRRTRDLSASPRLALTPTLAPRSPAVEPAYAYSPQSTASAASASPVPELYGHGFDVGSRYQIPSPADVISGTCTSGRRERTRSGAMRPTDDVTPENASKRTRTRSGASAVHDNDLSGGSSLLDSWDRDTDVRKSRASTRARSSIPEPEPAFVLPREARADNPPQSLSNKPASPVPPPLPPRHRTRASPMLDMGVLGPSKPPQCLASPIEDVIAVAVPSFSHSLPKEPKRERTKGAGYEDSYTLRQKEGGRRERTKIGGIEQATAMTPAPPLPTAAYSAEEVEDRPRSSKSSKPRKAITADQLTAALENGHMDDQLQSFVVQDHAPLIPPNAVPMKTPNVREIKRERTTTWTAGQVLGNAIGVGSSSDEKENKPAEDMRKRERTKSAGSECEPSRPPRERTRSAAAVSQAVRPETAVFDVNTLNSKRSRSKSGGAVLQENPKRETISDDMHAILFGQMPDSPSKATRTPRQTQMPKRQSSRGSTATENEGGDSEEVARHRAEALAALSSSAPNTPKGKGTPGRKSRPTTANAAEGVKKSETAKLKGLGMDIPFEPENENRGRRTPVQSTARLMDNIIPTGPFATPAGSGPSSKDYSHLFAALSGPYTPPITQASPQLVQEPEVADGTQSEYETEASVWVESAEEYAEEVVWDGREQVHQRQHDRDVSEIAHAHYEPAREVPDLQRKPSGLRPPTTRKGLSSATSVSSLAWSGAEEVEQGFSFAAERLMAGLNAGQEEAVEEEEAEHVQYEDSAPDASTPKLLEQYGPDQRIQQVVHQHHESVDRESIRRTGSNHRTWRSTLSSTAVYQSLCDRYGSLEIHRQELIWELMVTESAFVHDLRLVIRLFIQPLRDRSQPPTWIPGVPAEVGRLFDWLDDIVQLHAEIARVLHSARQSQYPIVTSCAALLLPMVAKLEVHQPYLVRLEEVTNTVERMMKEPESDFGEFLRMQSVSEEWDGLSLGSWLLKPVQRLTKYALVFKQLLQSTPRNHQDHLASLSLYYTTDTAIRIMREVKVREEEYDMVKMLVSRIAGLPPDFHLAERGRKLLAQGPLLRIEGADQYRSDEDTRPRRPSSRYDRGRAGTYNPRLSMQSISHSDSSSYDWPSTPSLAPPESPWSLTEVQSNLRTPSPNQADYFGKEATSRPGSVRSVSSSGKGRETPVYVFVFTDLVVLTTPMSDRNPLLQNTRGSKRAPQWRLLQGFGLNRALGMSQLSDKFGFDFVLSLDLLPITTDGRAPLDAGPSTTVYLTLVDNAVNSSESLTQIRRTWTDAFESTLFHTIRSISFPSIEPFSLPLEHGLLSKAPDPASYHSDSLPRSPSAFAQNQADPVEVERGEREWWSHRFKQVAEELMRDGAFRPSALVEVPPVQGSSSAQRTESAEQRRRRISGMHQGGARSLELAVAAASTDTALGSANANANATARSNGANMAGSDAKRGVMRLLARKGR